MTGQALPKLVKVRKQLHGNGRSRTGTTTKGELRLGFNVFSSIIENSGRVNNDNDFATSASNRFVFGTKWRTSASNLNFHSNKNLSSGGNVKERGSKMQVVKFGNVGFVLVAKQRQVSKNKRKFVSKIENRKLDDSVGFVFDNNGNNARVKLDREKTKLSECIGIFFFFDERVYWDFKLW